MKRKLLSILLILMMAVSVLVINTEQVFAAESTRGIAIETDLGRLEYKFIDDEQGKDPYLQYLEKTDGAEFGSTITSIPGIEIDGVEYVRDENNEIIKTYGVIKIQDNIELKRSNNNHTFIDSCIPLIIESEAEKKTITMTGDYNPQDGKNFDVTGIYVEGDLIIRNVNINFFPELKNISEFEDRYSFFAINIDTPEHQGKKSSLDNTDAYSSNLEIENSTLNVYGTSLVDDGVNGDIYINNSKINVKLLFPKSSEISYRQCGDGCLFTDGTITITNGSEFEVNASVPQQIINEGSPSPYIESAVIAAQNLIINESSKLTINETEYHFLAAVMASNITIEKASVYITGSLFSMQYRQFNTGDDDKLYAESTNEGFTFKDADFELTSLLSNLYLLKKSGNFPTLTITESLPSNHIDFIRIMGGSDSAQEVELPSSVVHPVVLVDPTMLNINTDEFLSVKGSKKSSVSEDPEYTFDYSIDGLINDFRAIQFTPKAGSEPIEDIRLTIFNANGLATNYLPDGSVERGDTPIDAFGVTYQESTGFTVEVLKDYTFTKKQGDIQSCFFMCRGADLNIIGDKTLTFNIEYPASDQHSSQGSLRTQCFRLMSTYDLFISGKDTGALKIDIYESGEKNGEATSSSIFSDEYVKNLDENKPPVADFFLNKVNITSNAFSPAIRFDNHNASITNSTFTYNYVEPTAIKMEKRYFGVFLLMNNLLFENSKIIINGAESLYSNPNDTTEPVSLAFEIKGKLTFKDCDAVSVKGFDVGIASTNFESINSNIDVDANRGGIVAMQTCSIELSKDNSFNVKSKLAPDISKNIYPALYSGQADKSKIFKLSNDIDIYDAAGNKIDLSKLDGVTSIIVKEKEDNPTPTPKPDPTPEHHSGNTYSVPKTGILY